MPDEPIVQPLILVLAGPNGAGKSTAASSLLPPGFPFVNADEVAKTLPNYPSPAADLEAGRLVLIEMDDLAASRASFAVETTLAGRTLASRIGDLRRSGYLFHLRFVYAPDPDYCIRRVAARVRAGGHSIPPETIRRRYVAGIRNFFGIYQPIADEWSVHENTQTRGFRIIAAGEADRVDRVDDPDIWARFREASR